MPRDRQTRHIRTGDFVRGAAFTFGAILMGGCADSGPIEITGERLLAPEEQEIRLVESDAERFRSRTPVSQGGGGGPAGGRSGFKFDYDLPEGWSEAPRAMMRELNFTFGDNGEGECYLTFLPGVGGGLVDNVNRWRGQMGLEPAGADEIAALPKKKLFGQEATFVSLDGDFTGVGATETKKDYRMLGLILWNEQAGAIFAKLTGPRELVENQGENFDALCESIRPQR